VSVLNPFDDGRNLAQCRKMRCCVSALRGSSSSRSSNGNPPRSQQLAQFPNAYVTSALTRNCPSDTRTRFCVHRDMPCIVSAVTPLIS